MHSSQLSIVVRICAWGTLLTGCLATAPKIDPEDREALTPVAVTSLLDNDFHLRSIGFTVFQNKSAPQNIADWNPNGLLESASVGALRTAGMPSARELPLADLTVKNIEEVALTAAQRAGVKTLVTIGYMHAENQPFLNPGSYGIYNRAANTCLYSKFFVTVWNVGEKSRRKGSPQVECSRLDGIVWKSTLAEYSTEETARIRKALISQLNGQITNALSDTGITSRAP